MQDSLDAPAKAAAQALIIGKRDELLNEQRRLVSARAEILVALRRIDRELADCRAAARLFNLDVEFPLDDREERDLFEREVAQRNALRHAGGFQPVPPPPRVGMAALTGISFGGGPAREISVPPEVPVSKQAAVSAEPAPNANVIEGGGGKSPRRPSVREFILDQLALAGRSGSKAAPLREAFERTFGEMIHEKTVGMTLYRLSREGLVRRDGHTWFLASSESSGFAGENPGDEAPGPNNSVD